MMVAVEYLGRSRLFQRPRSGPHGQLVELYTARLVKEGFGRHSTWRSLSVLGDLLSWLTRIGSMPTDLNERMVEQYLRHRSRKLPLSVRVDRGDHQRYFFVPSRKRPEKSGHFHRNR
jgi:hypothetical protein